MIAVTIHSTVSVTVTRQPCWLARVVLGRKETVRDANRVRVLGGTYGWLYTDNREVEPEVTAAIDRALAMRAVRLHRVGSRWRN